MQAEDFFRVISEFEFICDDIVEIKQRIDLTKINKQPVGLMGFQRIMEEMAEEFADMY